MYADLIERLERAEGPDRSLDLDLARALVPDVIVLKRDRDTGENHEYTYWHYTESLDAALSLRERLCPPGRDDSRAEPRAQFGHTLSLAQTFDWRWNATLYRVSDGLRGEANASTPALAVCLALLRALSVKEKA